MAIALVFTVVADDIAGDHGGQVMQVCELCVRLRVKKLFSYDWNNIKALGLTSSVPFNLVGF